MTLFKNDQWAVTEEGLQSIKPGAPYEYYISADRLLEKGGAGRGEVYDWPLQLAEKTWVDLEAFIQAYRKAIEIHVGKYSGAVDQDLLELSIQKGREEAARI